MRSKIEVSVAKLADQYEETARGPSPGWIGAEVVAKQLRLILAAPVVERQPDSEIRHAAVKSLHDTMQAVPCSSLYSLAEAVLDAGYAAPPELAELQATNERLQATCDGLDSQNDALADTIARLTAKNEYLTSLVCGCDRCGGWQEDSAEIDRLKGGQGEPVAWMPWPFLGLKKDICPFVGSKLVDVRGGGFETTQRADQTDWRNVTQWREHGSTSQPAPVSVVHPFAEKVLSKLQRFEECASDSGADGVDIGRHWLDLLTQLGLLNRVQRSPALWEITQQGEDCLDKVKELNQ